MAPNSAVGGFSVPLNRAIRNSETVNTGGFTMHAITQNPGRDTWHDWGRTEVHTEFWYQNMKVVDRLKGLGVDGSIILNGVLEK